MLVSTRLNPILLSVLLVYGCTHKDASSQTQHGSDPPAASTGPVAKILPPEPCEGCEIMFLGMPYVISAVDTTAGWLEEGQKLRIEGTVYKSDQKTPASDVILYFYHTDRKGLYSPRDNMLPSAKRHGHLRGWVKTGSDGRYKIYTSRPAQYPNQDIQAHIHVFVKEPYLDIPYYIDEWIFDDDPLVTASIRQGLKNRGGSGILTVTRENDVQVAKHDIVLGLNIPGYPD